MRSEQWHVECLRSNAIMFYNYFRNAVRLRSCALHYTQDHACLHSQYLLSRVEGSAHAITFRLRKSNCILRQQPFARTTHGTSHSYGPPYTSVVLTRSSEESPRNFPLLPFPIIWLQPDLIHHRPVTGSGSPLSPFAPSSGILPIHRTTAFLILVLLTNTKSVLTTPRSVFPYFRFVLFTILLRFVPNIVPDRLCERPPTSRFRGPTVKGTIFLPYDIRHWSPDIPAGV